MQPAFGAKRCGLAILDLEDDASVTPQLVEPDGLIQLTLLRDIPDPYQY
jgi:hypothetical protein